MDEDFRKAALDYHRLPRPGKLAIEPTKRMATQRDLALAYSPGVAAACEAIKADPDTAHDYTARGNLVGGDLQRHRRARARQYRRARRQAGDGGQGGPVQEIRRHRRVRHRGRRSRPGPLLRRGGGAGAHLRRDQPGGHQGARMLRDRAELRAAHAASRCSTTTSTAPPSPSPPPCATACCCRARSSSEVKLVTSGAGAAALACVDLLVAMGAASRERDADRHQGRGPRQAATGHAAQHGALCPRTPTRGRCRTCCRAPTSSWACPRRAC